MAFDVITHTDFLSTVFESLTGYAIAAIDFDGRIIAFNEGARAIYGHAPEEVIGKANIEILFTPEFVESGRLSQVITEALSLNKSSVQEPQVRKNGERFPAEILFSPCRDRRGNVIGFVLIAQDITDRTRAAAALQRSEAGLRQLIEKTTDGIIIIDRDAVIGFANTSAGELFHRRPEQLVGSPFGFPVLEQETSIIQLVLPGGNESAVEMHTTDIEWGGAPAVMISLHDITEHKRIEKALYDLSLNDELTGLYNRRGFLALAEQQMKVTRRLGQKATLVFVDVDGMKWINDTLGHEQGDAALVATATLLRTTFRDSDIVARMGGDEFAIFMLDCSVEKAQTAIGRLVNGITAYNEAEGNRWKLALSSGMASCDPLRKNTLAELLDLADHEMYRQKTAKRKPVVGKGTDEIST